MKERAPGFFENKTKVILFLLLPSCLVYLKSIRFDFTVLDEQWMIVQNENFLKSWTSFGKAFLSPVAQVYYRPVFMLSLILDYHLGQLSPFIYHLSNLLWHLLSVLLVYRFFQLFDVKPRTAFIFALIFSVHPLMVHAVAWIPGRNDTMLCVFALSSLIYLDKCFSRPGWTFMALHLLLFTAALLTKENAIALPLIYICFLYGCKRASLKSFVWMLCAWTFIACLWFFCRQAVISRAPAEGADLMISLKNFSHAFISYVGKAIFPFRQSIYPALRHQLLWPGILAILLLVILCFKPGLRNKGVAFFGLFVFAILLVIPVWFSVSGGGNEQYEHRIYTSLAGLLLFFTQVKFDESSAYFKYPAYILLALFFIRSYTRMDVYKNKRSFVQCGIKECPDFYIFHFQLGELNYEKRDFYTSLENFSTAIRLRPDMHEIYNNRGSAYYYLGKYKEALADFNTAIRLSEFNPDYYRNRCLAYHRSGEVENAMKDFHLLRKCCGKVLPPVAEEEVIKNWDLLFDKVNNRLISEPGNAALYHKRARLLFDIENIQTGVKDLAKACELDPSNTLYRSLLEKYASAQK